MMELKIGLTSVDLPYTIRVHGVTEDLFDEWVDEDTKAELLDGVMIVHSPASLQHEDIASFLGGLMSFYIDDRGLGKVIASGNGVVHLATCRKFAPDIFFIRQSHVPTPLPKEFEGAPDLVVEVLSSSTRRTDLEEKRPAYQEAGVAEMWFVDMDSPQILVDRRGGQDYVRERVTGGRVTSTVIPGFWIEAAWLWAEPLPNRMSCLQEILRSR